MQEPPLSTTTKRPKQPQTPWFVPPNHLSIRLLCHVSRVGGLIGKSGSIIRQLQLQSGAKIRVEDLPPSPPSPPSPHLHRVILIIGSLTVSKKLTLHVSRTVSETKLKRTLSKQLTASSDGDDKSGTKKLSLGLVEEKGKKLTLEEEEKGCIEGSSAGNIELSLEGLKMGQEEEERGWVEGSDIGSIADIELSLNGGKMGEEKGGDSGEEVEVSAVQEAVVRVFERVIEVAAESEGGVGVEGIVSCRLLVEKGQVGTLIGKGGKTIEMIKREAGCRVKVLNKERLPSCAMANDELVEVINGE